MTPGDSDSGSQVDVGSGLDSPAGQTPALPGSVQAPAQCQAGAGPVLARPGQPGQTNLSVEIGPLRGTVRQERAAGA